MAGIGAMKAGIGAMKAGIGAMKAGIGAMEAGIVATRAGIVAGIVAMRAGTVAETTAENTGQRFPAVRNLADLRPRPTLRLPVADPGHPPQKTVQASACSPSLPAPAASFHVKYNIEWEDDKKGVFGF